MKMGEIKRLVGERGGRIAVVGSGIAGLASAWLLSRRFEVTLFEADERLGGHSNTVGVEQGGLRHPVDTGFLVFNRRTYPNLCALFAVLGVETVASDMSFAVSLAEPELEWAGSGLGTVFAQRRNLVRPAFHGMLRDILRFNAAATRVARDGGGASALALGAYLERERYGVAFRDWYLLPMAAAIWSCPTRTMLDYPLATFARFCDNHGLLQLFDRPQWLTVRGGAREYVRRIAAALDDVRLRTPVLRAVRGADCVWLHTRDGAQAFDQVVFACHSDQALRILGESVTPAERAILGESVTPAERAILGAVRYQDNVAMLHTDTALLPRRRQVWSAWNYLGGQGGADGCPVSVSYLINRLQPLPFDTPLVLSLNPFVEPARDKLLQTFHYAHPVFDQAAIDAQARLEQIQGRRRCWFAGAWTGYGFHEDGLKSALAVVEALGAPVPWRGAAVEEVTA